MKILLVVTKACVGGAQETVLNLAKGLKARGNEVVVGFGEGDFLKKELEENNIKCLRFNNLKRSGGVANLFFIFEIRKFLNKNKFDVVHFHSSNSLFGSLGAKLSFYKPKTVFTVHGLSVLDKNYQANIFVKKIFWLFFKMFFKFIDRVVFVSETNFLFAKKIKLVKNSFLVYNGIDLDNLDFLDKNKARDFLSKKIDCNLEDYFIIGSIGRLAYPKNYEFLINNFQAIKKIEPKAKIIIIGEGSERKKYEDLIKNLDLKKDVFLTGEIFEAKKYLKAFNLFVLPSIYEGLAITLIEALAAEVDTLASDVGGNKEVVGSNNCYELNNFTDFLSKIKEKNKIKSTKKELFSLTKMVDSYLTIYKN